MRVALPTFIGIGAAKCGTTSIYNYLAEHPEVFMSPMKETNFFGYEGQQERRFRVRSWPAYEQQFAAVDGELAIGEFSPMYMNYPRAAARIAEALPDAKLLVSLRSPTERAYSCWAGSIQTAIERRPAEEALWPGESYVDRGCYSERLAPYLEVFPRERIEIVLFEDLAADPAGTMAQIYRFIGVDPGFVPDVTVRHNAAAFPRHQRLNAIWQRVRRLQPRNYQAPAPIVRLNRALLERSFEAPPPIDPALRARLQELYRDEVGRMEELLGRDLSHWRR